MPPIYYYTLTFIFGLVVGSFLNVCICRIPEGGDIVKEPSHCMSCGQRLAWYDMIPVVSWLILRGRCRQCGAHISAVYPAVELMNAVMWTVTAVLLGISWYSGFSCLMISALIVLSFIDARTLEIPRSINIFIFITGAAAAAADRSALFSHLAGMFAVSVPLALIYLFSHGRAIGGGDVRLMAGAGLLLGLAPVLTAFLLACLYAVIIHITRMKISGAEHVLAMGPYLSAGIITALWFGNQISGWYLSLF